MSEIKNNRLKRSLYFGLGFFFLVLSYIGILLPGVPAIPFILLTAFFFTNSSDKLSQWLLRQKIIGKAMQSSQSKKGKRGYILFVISQLWVSIGVAEVLFVTDLYWGIALILCGLAFSYLIYVLLNK
ncbi:MAG: YbaN family protein [bacterium]|nr:YbaN family protein [bacterium]